MNLLFLVLIAVLQLAVFERTETGAEECTGMVDKQNGQSWTHSPVYVLLALLQSPTCLGLTVFVSGNIVGVFVDVHERRQKADLNVGFVSLYASVLCENLDFSRWVSVSMALF